jgi:beta-lactamase regulating signal transducer with metallopeptidase domain
MSEQALLGALAWGLDLLVRATLLSAAGAAVVLTLRRSSAELRHLVCGLTLAGLLALPALMLLLPRWDAPLLPPPVEYAAESPAPTRDRQPLTLPTGRPTPSIQHPTPNTQHLTPTTQPPTHPPTWLPLLWAAGFCFAAGFLAANLSALRRFRRGCTDLSDPHVRGLAAECARSLGVAREIVLLETSPAELSVPMTWGWRRPVLVLPFASAAWPASRLKGALLHELAHIRRADWLWALVGRAACVLYWFHPLVWWLAHRARTESEEACDQRVLGSGMPAPDYAESLLEIVRMMNAQRQPASAAMSMAHGPRLESRLRSILEGRRRGAAGAASVLLCAALVMGAVVPVAAVKVTSKKVAPAAPAPLPTTAAPAPTPTVPAIAPPAPVEPVPMVPMRIDPTPSVPPGGPLQAVPVPPVAPPPPVQVAPPAIAAPRVAPPPTQVVPEAFPPGVPTVPSRLASPVPAELPAIAPPPLSVLPQTLDPERLDLERRMRELEERMTDARARAAEAAGEAPGLLLRKLEAELADTELKLLRVRDLYTEDHPEVRKVQRFRDVLAYRLSVEKVRAHKLRKEYDAERAILRDEIEKLQRRLVESERKKFAEQDALLKMYYDRDGKVKKDADKHAKAAAKGGGPDAASRSEVQALRRQIEALTDEVRKLREQLQKR